MDTYDFIVVGAGSAGAPVAHRLSADPRHKVLLIEAGPASNPWSRIPIGYAKLLTNPAANWLYSSEPEAATNGRKIPVPRGKILGGSSSINGLAFVRGQAQDFDTWAQMGNHGWSYDDVLPFFRRMERYEAEGDDTYRGREGPLRVTNPEPRDAIFQALIRAAGEVGIRHNPDYNGATQDGIAMSQATIANGWRQSTAACYLDPIRKRQNLRIVTDALTEGVILEGKRCVGVRYSIGGTVHEARSGRDVVISAGSINSPQLLELSGIGQAERLQGLGIEVRHALPGVGENLRDHYAPRTRWAVGKKGITLNDRARGLGMVGMAMKWAFLNQGMLGAVAAPMRAFVKSRAGLEAPDLLADRLVGAAVGWLSFAGIAAAYRRLRGRDGLGGGDARLLGAGGAWLGWEALPSVVLFAAVGALLGIGLRTLWLRGKPEAGNVLTEPQPFGPWLALGIWVVRLHGPILG